VVQFQDGKMASERIYWDQPRSSSVRPVGPGNFLRRVAARKVLDDQLPSNDLMKRTLKDKEL
jgi:hypothetical protein